MVARYIIGDTRDVTATLPDGSVDLILTSPPFLALRSYLPADHPDKGREIGSEANPAEFVDVLLALSAEWRRVLAPHGSIAIELGDTYAGGGGLVQSREHRPERDGTGADGGSRMVPEKDGPGWPLAKSLALIPELYRIGLAYGINPLTGAESPAGKWRVRNVVRWCRPNPPVGALGDKYRPSTSEMVVACPSGKRWFDLDAVRYTPQDQGVKTTNGPKMGAKHEAGLDGRDFETRLNSNPAGAPPLDHWIIPTHPFRGAHYATWPPALCTVPIESMCPREVCTACGTPRRRMVGEAEYVGSEKDGARADGVISRGGRSVAGTTNGSNSNLTRVAPTLGWTDCECGAPFRPGVVLDPFAGSGTTLMVATGHGRDAIGIDLDERNADLARDRVGMFLQVEEGVKA